VHSLALQYAQALDELRLSDKDKAMLRAHFLGKDQTINSVQLAQAAGHPGAPGSAYRWYCTIGLRVGEKKFERVDANEHQYCSVLTTSNPLTVDLMEHVLVMRPEVAEAIEYLGWFQP
jgi:hypothetical protein